MKQPQFNSIGENRATRRQNCSCARMHLVVVWKIGTNPLDFQASFKQNGDFVPSPKKSRGDFFLLGVKA
jgi:hypothetical protein